MDFSGSEFQGSKTMEFPISGKGVVKNDTASVNPVLPSPP